MDSEALQEFESTRGKVAHTAFIWPLCLHTTVRAGITLPDVTVLLPLIFSSFSTSPAFSPPLHPCLCQNQSPLFVFSSVSPAPALSLDYHLCSHLSLSLFSLLLFLSHPRSFQLFFPWFLSTLHLPFSLAS